MMKFQRCLCFLSIIGIVFFSSVQKSYAQQGEAIITVMNAKKEPVAFATVVISSFPDSTNKFQKITDSSGKAAFDLTTNHPYRIEITAVDYTPLLKNLIIKTNASAFTFTLQSASKTLNAVVVTATRPVMRQEDDKTIVDPENLASSSTNAYEILEKVPGLFVDSDGNIYLSSTTPATIYINGREQKMSTADVATMLKSLPPNSIASIEILRTPSARYDASGSGGIVNVVLRKGVKVGLTGSVNIGAQQGRYGNQLVGLNLNNNNGRLTTYLNLQISKRNTYERITTNRLFAKDSLLSQDALTVFPTNSYYAGYGANYLPGKKWEVSYDGRISINDSKNKSTNTSLIEQVSSGAVLVNNEADVQNKLTNFSIAQGLSAKYKIDSIGSEWTTDVSFTYNPSNSGQVFTTSFFEPQIHPVGGDGTIKNNLQFFSAQTSLQKKLLHTITIETGLKATQVVFHNTTAYFKNINNNRTEDAVRSGAYQYHENINAAYVQASKTLKGITLKAGTRLENTNMTGNQFTPKDTSFAIHRTDLFPYIYLSRSVMKIAGYDLKAYLVYRRTISRPAYEYLNPSRRYVDPYLFETGNPSLRPQFTKNYEANISVGERPLFAVGVNDTKDIFTQVVYQADSSKSQAYRTYDNLGTNKEKYFRVLGAIPPGKRYFFVIGAQYNHNAYQGFYEGKPLMFQKGSWSLFTYQTFKVTKTTQLTLNGFARFNGQLQFYELSSFGALNMSINQQLLNKKLIVSLSAADMLFTNKNNFTLQQGSVSAYGLRESDTRRLGINIRYNFGLRKKEEANLLNIESPEKTN